MKIIQRFDFLKRLFALFTLCVFTILFFLPVRIAIAAVTVTTATGGSNISADTTGGTYTSLTGPIISEGVTADIGLGTIILSVPSGFVFDTSAGSVTATRTDVTGTGCNAPRRLLINGGASQVVTPTLTTITINISQVTSSGCRNIITWTGIKIRPANGTPLASGNITKSGTSNISGITADSTNLGTLIEVAGAKSQLVVTTQPSSTALINTDFSTKPVVAIRDQFGNTVTNDSSSTITRTAVLSTQVCGGTLGSGILTSTPATGSAVSSGILTYTAMQYSSAESIKICFTSLGITSALSNIIVVSAPPDTTAPSAVSDLSLSGATNNSINVAWTAPGDDGNIGTATTYDLRYSTSAITAGNFSSATPVTGEPTPSIAGTSESMTVSGLSPSTVYYFALKTSDEVPNTSAVSNVVNEVTAEDSPTVIISDQKGGGTPSIIAISGRAYPKSKIQVIRKSIIDEIYKNIPVSSSEVKDDGRFSINYFGLIGDKYLLTFQAVDKDGRKTSAISFNIDLTSQNLLVENLLLPPTFGIKTDTIKRGSLLEMEGYAFPQSVVELNVNGRLIGETRANMTGYWYYATSTKNFSLGLNSAKARQIVKTEDVASQTSDYSLATSFRITNLLNPFADFNGDEFVNISDWSIFLFRWGSKDTILRKKIDMDNDGKITIADFSLFLTALKF